MTKRIFRSIWLVALVVFLASVSLVMGVLFRYFTGLQQRQLHTETMLAARGVARMGEDYFEDLDIRDCRITWIDGDGTVLYDSQTDALSMPNHASREEVREAMELGYGESRRYSDTLMERYLYSAARLPDGTVIRLSSQQSIVIPVVSLLQPVALVLALALCLAIFLADRVSRSIVRPLNELNLDQPLRNEDYDELAPLLSRIDSQQKQLQAQKTELRRRQKEFEAITESMNEGLVLLNARGRILSINSMAARLLGTTSDCVGRDILAVNRTPELRELLEEARAGHRDERILRRDGSGYQMEVSPVLTDGAVTGVVLLFIDITEKERAEEMRREFTANVSHELKTPLHTISGCAELLRSGLVKPEDESQFVGQIYGETQRLIRLVEDIINLSHLDEGAVDMQWEPVDLQALAQSTAASLAPVAGREEITISVLGTPAVIPGISRLLEGIVYNLCDNAVKYNRPGGTVTIETTAREGGAVLAVRDTGIGVPPEHQQRIFERFYRVDKSHSKAVGGTGLGLSIVKHAARVHGASVDLQSNPGEGTVITVTFPAGNKGAISL